MFSIMKHYQNPDNALSGLNVNILILIALSY